MRLCITGHHQGDYLYPMYREGIIMNYKEYEVNKHKKRVVG